MLDDLFFCRDGRDAERVYSFLEASARVDAVPGGARAVCDAYRRRIRELAPLSLRISADRGLFVWKFGPYDTGSYSVLIGDDLVRFGLPRQGRHRPVIPDETRVTLRYESPEGWLTFSPPLPLTIENGRARIVWSR